MNKTLAMLGLLAIIFLGIGIYLGWLDNGQKPYQGYYRINQKN